MNILIVEDSRSMRGIIRNVITQIPKNINLRFNHIQEAEDGKIAYDILSTNPNYDLILLDQNMPNMTGLELLKTIKKEKSLQNIPVIMITTVSEKSKIKDAIVYGAKGYIFKPFDADAIVTEIKRVFDL